MGQSIKLTWPPMVKVSVSESEQFIQMHAVVYKLLQDISAPSSAPLIRSSNTSVNSKDPNSRDDKTLNALRALHELTASKFKENR
jgi:hypothetical protein